MFIQWGGRLAACRAKLRWGPNTETNIITDDVYIRPRSLPVETTASRSIRRQGRLGSSGDAGDITRITDDLKIMILFRPRMELLDAAGATKRWAGPVEEQTFGVHLLGTCRRQRLKRSVVNKYHQAM